jgi:NADH-quinone oxidoreductase subunit C/D
MFNRRDLEQHKNVLSEVGDSYSELLGQHHIDLRPKDLLRWIELCKDDLGYLTLVDLAGVDRSERASRRGYQLELSYLLFNMGSHQRINLHLHFNPGEIIPSISSYFSHADWLEREQAEMLGISFGKKILAPLLLPKNAGHPLRKNSALEASPPEELPKVPKLRFNPNKSEKPYPEESWIWKEFNILSPMSQGSFLWQVCFDPKEVVDSRTKIGFFHRGLEKMMENKSWMHVMQLVDLIHPGAAPTYSTAWAKNLEEILSINLTERAQAIRMVLLELARVADHLTVLYEISFALEKDEYRLFLNAREKIYELFEKYSGQRQGMGSICLGGVREDLPHGWIIEYQAASELLLKNLKIIHNSLISQRNFRSHLDHSPVNAQTALQWGVVGPAMRASGLNFDLRKSQPLYFYQDVDFDVPVGIHGTSYDRYLIRYEEINQSLRIITQVLDNLPLGEVVNTDFEIPKSFKGEWHYSSLESPNGEAGFYHLYSADMKPYRLKVKTPSFTLTQALPEFVRGLEEWQLPGALASLGIRKAEQDR